MMTKMTKAQHRMLTDIRDWTPDRLGREIARMHSTTVNVLYRLRRMGLVDFNLANLTYRINEAGRAALKSSGGEG